MLRQFNLSIVLALCVVWSWGTSASGGDETNSEKESSVVSATPRAVPGAREARQQALQRQRRIIFNDDTYELSREDANTPEGFLRRRLKPLVGTHVDTISWSVLGGWGDAPVYDSRIQPHYGPAHGGPPEVWSPFTARNIRQMIQSGNCPLQTVIDFAHNNEMELFASIRMNDVHDSFIPKLVTLWKKSHPELLVDRSVVGPNMDFHVTSQDFTHQEVRDRKFEIIEEVCQRYDIDGVDLNFIRHPCYFSRTIRGEPVTAEETRIMTNLVRRIRSLTDQQGVRRGTPILLAAIVPDNFELAMNIGLDVETWIENDLIDIVIPGLGYAPFSLPVRDFTEVARRHGVKVYPCINRVAPWEIPAEQVADGFRGVATNWYRAGADGIFFWNLGTPIEGQSGQQLIATRNHYYAALSQLGDPRILRHKDKIFCIDDEVFAFYQHISSQRPFLPVELKPGAVQRIEFEVGDQVRGTDTLAGLELVLHFQGKVRSEDLDLRLNGEPLPRAEDAVKKGDHWIVNFHPSAAQVTLGTNELHLSLKRRPNREQEAVQLDRLRFRVRYSK